MGSGVSVAGGILRPVFGRLGDLFNLLPFHHYLHAWTLAFQSLITWLGDMVEYTMDWSNPAITWPSSAVVRDAHSEDNLLWWVPSALIIKIHHSGLTL